MNTQFKKGALEMCVIAVLYNQDCYGYELVNRISESIHITEGTIYPLLRRLSDDGYVSTYLKESQGGAPRKYYNLNETGRERCRTLIKDWQQFAMSVDSLLRDVKFEDEESIQ